MSCMELSESYTEMMLLLRNANLLQYLGTFLKYGGDDVKQLQMASEEEFLEIISLVGMSSKPLHVQRLRKALSDWKPEWKMPPLLSAPPANPLLSSSIEEKPAAMFWPAMNPAMLSVSTLFQQQTRNTDNWPRELKPEVRKEDVTRPSGSQILMGVLNKPQRPAWSESPGLRPSPIGTPTQKSEVASENQPLYTGPSLLSEQQIENIKQAATKVAQTLGPIQPKKTNLKSNIEKKIQSLYDSLLAGHGPEIENDVRQYAAIYGRFDCTRKKNKPIGLHEMCVNESAHQLCMLVPPLITQRNMLFVLSRRVVRDSGYKYSKGHSRSLPRDIDGTILRPTPAEDSPRPSSEPQSDSKDDSTKGDSADVSCSPSRLELSPKLEDEESEQAEDEPSKLVIDSPVDEPPSKRSRPNDEINSTSATETLGKKRIAEQGDVEVKLEKAQIADVTKTETKSTADTASDLSKSHLMEEGLKVAEQLGMTGLVDEILDLRKTSMPST